MEAIMKVKLEETQKELQQIIDKMNEVKSKIKDLNKEGENLATYANRVQGRIDVLEAIVKSQEAQVNIQEEKNEDIQKGTDD